MRRIGEHAGIVRLVAGRGGEARYVHLLRKIFRMVVPGATNLCELDAAAWTEYPSVAEAHVRFLALQQVGSDLC